MFNTISESEISSLRARWSKPEGQAILQRLYSEKIYLPTLHASLEAVKKAFDVTDLRGIDFSNQEFVDQFLLFELNLSYASFDNARIRGSLQASKLIGSSFVEAEILGVYFTQADLCTSSFENAVLHRSEFEGANLTGVSFVGAHLESVGFQNTDLTSVDFSNSSFGRVDFANAKMRKTVQVLEAIGRSSSILNQKTIVWV